MNPSVYSAISSRTSCPRSRSSRTIGSGIVAPADALLQQHVLRAEIGQAPSPGPREATKRDAERPAQLADRQDPPVASHETLSQLRPLARAGRNAPGAGRDHIQLVLTNRSPL